jgi:general secretion pathway protein G
MQHRRNRQRGFTLMEIMVVIFIIGLLIAVVAPSVLGNQDKAMKQKVMADLATLEQALDMYRLDNLRFPSSEQGLAALVKKPARSRCRGPGAAMATCVACRKTRGAPRTSTACPANMAGSMCTRWVPMACRVAKARMPTWVTGRCNGASSARLQPDRTAGGAGHRRADDRAGGGRLGNGQASVEQALQRLAATRAQAALARHAGQLRGCAGMASARSSSAARAMPGWSKRSRSATGPRACTRTGRPAARVLFTPHGWAQRAVCAGAGPMAASNGPGAATDCMWVVP